MALKARYSDHPYLNRPLLAALRARVTSPIVMFGAAVAQARADMGGYNGPMLVKVSREHFTELSKMVSVSGAYFDGRLAGVEVVPDNNATKSPVFEAAQ